MGAVGATACALVTASAAGETTQTGPIAAARQTALRHLVLQDCGSCHGMRLTGGLGPPLTREALAERPREGLVATILYGRRGTPMPPWQDFVSEAEAEWIVAQLLEGAVGAR